MTRLWNNVYSDKKFHITASANKLGHTIISQKINRCENPQSKGSIVSIV